jgi:hypothetical protein
MVHFAELAWAVLRETAMRQQKSQHYSTTVTVSSKACWHSLFGSYLNAQIAVQSILYHISPTFHGNVFFQQQVVAISLSPSETFVMSRICRFVDHSRTQLHMLCLNMLIMHPLLQICSMKVTSSELVPVSPCYQLLTVTSGQVVLLVSSPTS